MELVKYNNSKVVHRTQGSNPFTRGRYDRIRFMNGYGASVVQNDISYGNDRGLLEIAVLRFSGQGPNEFELCYNTPITHDVIGFLSQDDARAILDQIASLPPDAQALAGAILEEMNT